MNNTNYILLDGGMGQELYRRGIKGHQILWSANALISDPDAVRDIHVEFIRAGAQVITTNNYCTNPYRLREAGIEDRFAELTDTACRLAHEARDEAGIDGVQIAGCLPPLYGSYRPDLPRSFDKMSQEYRQMAEQQAPNVDFFLCETMTTAEEAFAAANAAKLTEKPVWLSWTLKDDGTGHLRSNETLEEAFTYLKDLDIDAFLVNCCAPESVTPALQQLRAFTQKPIGAYANGFTPIPEQWPAGDIEALDVREHLDPDRYAGFVREWIEQGASIVGGCCEISPAHIARLSEILKSV